jgi:nucleotide-binding universal stress UspA family protein
MLFEKILVAFDGSNLAKKALKKALELVEENPSTTLEIIHTYQIPTFILGEAYITASVDINQSYIDYAQGVLDEAKSLVPQHSNIHFVLKQGESSKVILEYANQTKCDLIVMGSRGLGGIREFILGSVSHNIVQHAKIPVLIIK